MVRQGTFREDLFYRLNLITVHMPALRERSDDIPELVSHFIRLQQRINGLDPIEVSAEALGWLVKLPYPGNIRELKNLIDRTLLVSGKKVLTDTDFKEQYIDIPAKGISSGSLHSLEEIEKNMISRAIDLYGGNHSKIAAALGLSRQALYRRMEKYGIRIPD